MPKYKIAVIGAGYTGLTAAYELAKKGHEVIVYEKTSNLGGLAGGFKIHGQNLEKAYHHLFRTDTDIISLAEELGVGEKLLWWDSSLSIYYGGKFYPFMTPIDLLKFSPLPFVDRIRAGLSVLYLQKTKNWKQFQKISAYKWMFKWAGKNVVKVIWEPLLKGKFHDHYQDVSMAWLWARIHIRANSKQSGDFTEKLGYFDGGFEIFTQALASKLEQMGVEIVLNADIKEIRSDKNPKLIFPAKVENFDRVIATVPSHVFANLAKSDSKEFKKYVSKLNSINYLGATLLIFSTKQSLSSYYWHNINDLNSPFLVFIQHTNLVPDDKYEGNHVYYIGTYVPHNHLYFDMEDEQIKHLWWSQLQKMFPDFDRLKVNESHIFRFKNAQHIVDSGYEKKIPAYQTPLENVLLANFSQIYPEDRGTNYAVREGRKISDMI